MEDQNTKITEYNNRRLYILLSVFVLSIMSWLLYQNFTKEIPVNTNNITQETEEVDVSGLPTLIAVVTVSSVNPIENNFVAKVVNIGNALGESLVPVTGEKEITIPITAKSTIQELIYATDAENYISGSNSIEINLADLQVGDLLYVTYRGEANDDKISNVEIIEKRIATTDLTKVYEEEMKRISNQRLSYAKVKVLSIDTNNKTLEYVAYDLQGVTSKTYTANYNDNTGFYYIDDLKRITIKHIKNNINPNEIKSGDDIYVNAGNESGELNGPVQIYEVVKIKSL